MVGPKPISKELRMRAATKKCGLIRKWAAHCRRSSRNTAAEQVHIVSSINVVLSSNTNGWCFTFLPPRTGRNLPTTSFYFEDLSFWHSAFRQVTVTEIDFTECQSSVPSQLDLLVRDHPPAPYSKNFNTGIVGVPDQTTNEMTGDTTIRDSNAESNNMTNDDHSLIKCSCVLSDRRLAECTNTVEGRTENNIGGAQNEANCGRMIQPQFYVKYDKYHEREDSDDERECSSSPCQAPWGYYEGFNHDFSSASAPVELMSTSPDTCERGHSQRVLYSCHPQNNGAYINKEFHKGTLIDSDKEGCSKCPKVPTRRILQPLPVSDSVEPTHGTTAP
ncbi:uncharacterized protein LACBIDRAFT_321313 [Laccaria bicolor S238N-H82]|uniref:Predicted protein n=1 Tax=Laccaria bicolor (strain S238N-H82 / ATCC MYA-4686) TaxID=486041 RepID=B0CPK7_LACBS|nr:uncharacterized protein LACBIDRAFT_321313 [Laccaria bicolor S238N-H82]EDR16107.1 predicted protein [Laccaria bicolor S238N-H82]|eukprot:XP_001874315.1 predicted protein [Laccaria bicolor S238N-H82]